MPHGYGSDPVQEPEGCLYGGLGAHTPAQQTQIYGRHPGYSPFHCGLSLMCHWTFQVVLLSVRYYMLFPFLL